VLCRFCYFADYPVSVSSESACTDIALQTGQGEKHRHNYFRGYTPVFRRQWTNGQYHQNPVLILHGLFDLPVLYLSKAIIERKNNSCRFCNYFYIYLFSANKIAKFY